MESGLAMILSLSIELGRLSRSGENLFVQARVQSKMLRC